MLAIIGQNSREPEKITGDVHAQIACLAVGARAVGRLTGRYGADMTIAAMDAVIAQAEAAMRSVISDIPDGTYAFEDFVDDDGQEAVGLAVQVEVRGDAC